MESTKILYVAQEIAPYVPESEMANLCRQLPQKMQEAGQEVRLFMPKFGHINERRNQLHEVIRLSGANLDIDDTDHPLIIKVASLPNAHMQVYFIDNEDFFVKKGIVSDNDGVEFDDNDERMIFFARGVMDTVKKLKWQPQIIHCNGFFSALIPFYLKKHFSEDPFFENAKIVVSLYNESFDSALCDRMIQKAVLGNLQPEDAGEFNGKALSYNDLMKFAMSFSDGVVIASDSVSTELISFADSLSKPVLKTSGSAADNVAAYNDFYNEVIK